MIPVPCGKCPACLSNRREEWSYRLKCEYECSKYGLFMTYTYDDTCLPVLTKKDNEYVVTYGKATSSSSSSFVLFPGHLRSYLHLLRERLRREGVTLRYYCIGEYGTHTYRPHYHALLFFNYEKVFIDPQKIDDYVSSSWHYGNVCFGHITSRSIRYCLKDMVKQQYLTSDYVRKDICKDNPDYRPFTIISRRPGLGSAFYQKHEVWFKKQISTNGTLVSDAHLVKIPRFYKEKYLGEYKESKTDAFGNKHESLSLAGKSFKKVINNKLKQQIESENERKCKEFGIDWVELHYLDEREREQDERQRKFRLQEKGGCL